MEMQTTFEQNVAKIIKNTLHLEIDSNAIDPEAPLYMEGLGLDSIDILEISVAVSKEFKIIITSDEASENNIFLSLRTLCQYIQEAESADERVMKESGNMIK